MNAKRFFVCFAGISALTGLAELRLVSAGAMVMPLEIASAVGGDTPACNKSEYSLPTCTVHPNATGSCTGTYWAASTLSGNELDVHEGANISVCNSNNCQTAQKPEIKLDPLCNRRPAPIE